MMGDCSERVEYLVGIGAISEICGDDIGGWL